MTAAVVLDEHLRVVVEDVVRALLPSGDEVVRASAHDGVVLLVGHVGWRSELTSVTEAVRAVPGVVEVQNRIDFHWRDE